MQLYPPHLRHVATLPWEVINSHFLQIFSRYGRKCKQIAFERFDKVTESLKVGTFFETQCSSAEA